MNSQDPNPDSKSDPLAQRMLNHAARLAIRAAGHVEPNPLVGCVLVRDGKIIGAGHHRAFGSTHAEVNAIDNAQKNSHDTRGSTAYVTLEPCNAAGKNPPCVDALVKAGVSRVVIAAKDPHPPAQPGSPPSKGGGAARLIANGIHVQWSNQSTIACALSAPFRKRLATKTPWLIAKWAQSLDGKLATTSGDSKWITSQRARRQVHKLRARVDGILSAVGTIIADQPRLDARDVPIRKLATRIILDPRAQLLQEHQSLVTHLLSVPTPLVLVLSRETIHRFAGHHLQNVQFIDGSGNDPTRIDPHSLLTTLARDHLMHTIMIEAGPRTLSLLANHIDEAHIYTGPMFIGPGPSAFDHASASPILVSADRWRLLAHHRIDDDLRSVYIRQSSLMI